MASKETRVSHVQMETSVTCKSSSQRYTYRYILQFTMAILGFMDVKPDSFQSQMCVQQLAKSLKSLGACRVQSSPTQRNSRFREIFHISLWIISWWCSDITLFQPLCTHLNMALFASVDIRKLTA